MGDETPGAVETPLPARLQPYLRARVTIHYNNAQGFTDTGTLTYLDSSWIELLKDSGERLLVPILAVRLIKQLDSGKREGDADLLLRPSQGQAQLEPAAVAEVEEQDAETRPSLRAC